MPSDPIYQHIAPHYEQDIAPYFAPLAQSFIESIPRPFKGHVLDVGTGTGVLARLINNPVILVVGLDSTPEMIAVAHGLDQTIDYVVGDIQQPPFVPAAFDWVIASFGLNGTEPRRTLRQLYRLLKPGGWLAIQEWGTIDPASQLIETVFDDFVTDAAAKQIAELMPAQIAWEDHLQDTADYHDLLSKIGYRHITATESAPTSVSTSAADFIRFRTAWLPYQLTLLALDTVQRNDLFEVLYRRLPPAFDWTPALFRVIAQRP